MFLIDDLLFWLPMKGIVALGRKIDELARAERGGDAGRLREELLRFQTRYELDEITEEEYTRREEEILRQLQSLRGGGGAAGPPAGTP